MLHTDARHKNFQEYILRYALGEELRDTNPKDLHPVTRLFFGGTEIKAIWEERTAILYIMFTEEPENPHIVLGFGDYHLQDFNGSLQWGIYANEGHEHELDIWGETPLMSPEKTIKKMFDQITEQLLTKRVVEIAKGN